MSQELARLAKDLGGIPKDLRKRLRPGIKKAAQPVLLRVRRNASYWSTRIPKATRLSVKFNKRDPGADIVVNRKRAPHARPYEHDGRPGTFRHPVYGNRKNWVTQNARPFAGPAVRQKGPEVAREIERVVDETLRDAGFR